VFELDSARSVDKRKALDPDRFGYISLHFICRIRKERASLTEYREFRGVCCEVQVRSILQHAWAEIEHDLGYKAGGTVPRPIRRRFSRLAGLLELADREFTLIRDDLADYTRSVPREIRERPAEVGIDNVSLTAFARTDEDSISLDNEMARHIGGKIRIDDDALDAERTVQMLRYVGISTIEQLRAEIRARRNLTLAQFRKRVREDREGWLPEAIGIYHMIQVILADKKDPSVIEQAFERLGIGDPAKLRESANEIIEAVHGPQPDAKKMRRSRP
jgi:putative GTP pyrophosphokinase